LPFSIVRGQFIASLILSPVGSARFLTITQAFLWDFFCDPITVQFSIFDLCGKHCILF
jgi:hypothetical protein